MKPTASKTVRKKNSLTRAPHPSTVGKVGRKLPTSYFSLGRERVEHTSSVLTVGGTV